MKYKKVRRINRGYYEFCVGDLKTVLTQRSLESKCKAEGHLIRDEGYCGSDSGSMDHSCARCGRSWYIQLY